jgi:hypothetical protein
MDVAIPLLALAVATAALVAAALALKAAQGAARAHPTHGAAEDGGTGGEPGAASSSSSRPAPDPMLALRLEALESRLLGLEVAAGAPAGRATSAAPGPDAFADLRERLVREGFERIRVIGRVARDVEPTSAEDAAPVASPTEIDVEAVRGGLLHRGRVRVPLPAAAEVGVAEWLKPATRLFP